MDKSATDIKRIKLIGDKLKKLRIKAKYKSAEIFAYENELNRVQYWRMEKGANFTMQSLLKVLNIHKITLEEFFKDLK
jgi:hypothetical protein